MADISSIKIPNGNSYNFKDSTLRTTISNLAVADSYLTTASFSKDNISLGNYTGDNVPTTAVDITITKSGYTPLGIVGVRLENASSSGTHYSLTHAIDFRLLNSTTARVYLGTLTTSGGAKVKVTVYVLYRKN